MQNLSFEDLMGLFLISKKNSDYEEVLNINKEFERRVSKRKLMQKKPMRTSVSGLEQTQEWLEKNSTLKKKDIEQNIDEVQKKKLNKRLREGTDLNKKKTLW
jgi:tRNA G10  N-methylase Trm11